MTRKDYRLIAKALSDKIQATAKLGFLTQDRYNLYKEVCEVLATRLAEDNSKFDRDKFLEACDATQN